MTVLPGQLPAFRPTAEYYDYVARGYDGIARSYDGVEAQNRVGRRIRQRMQGLLMEAFRPGDRVLDIGAGTGIEAIMLAERGVRIVATDVSDAMIRRTEEKALARGLGELQVAKIAAHEIGRLVERYGRASFDGSYSHGGVLNMDPDPEAVARGLAALLRPSARFLCSLVNQTSLFEILFYPAVLRPRKAFRRLGNVVPIPITRLEAHRRYVVPSRFYSRRDFLRWFSDGFRLRRAFGYCIVAPPWNLSDHMDRIEPVARAAEALDDFLSTKAPFREWGNILVLELERV